MWLGIASRRAEYNSSKQRRNCRNRLKAELRTQTPLVQFVVPPSGGLPRSHRNASNPHHWLRRRRKNHAQPKVGATPGVESNSPRSRVLASRLEASAQTGVSRSTGYLAEDAWIMDGNFDSTLSRRLRRADTALFLDLPRRTCLYAVLKRTLRFHGRTRPEMTPGCHERFDWAFLRWIWKYPEEARPDIIQQLDVGRRNGCSIITLKSRREVQDWLLSVRDR